MGFILIALAACGKPFQADNLKLSSSEIIQSPDGRSMSLSQAITSKIEQFEKSIPGFNSKVSDATVLQKMKNLILGINVEMGRNQSSSTASLSRTNLLVGTCAKSDNQALSTVGDWNSIANGNVTSLGKNNDLSVDFACLGSMVKGEVCSAALVLIRSNTPQPAHMFIFLKRNIGRSTFSNFAINMNGLDYVSSVEDKVKSCQLSQIPADPQTVTPIPNTVPNTPVPNVPNTLPVPNTNPSPNPVEVPEVFVPNGTEDQPVDPIPTTTNPVDNGGDQPVNPF